MDGALHTPAYSRPRSLFARFERKQGDPYQTHYCPGCGHGVVTNFIAEAIDDFAIQDRAVFINPVGCAVFSYAYLDVGNVVAAHGRAPAVATGIKRARPESVVICYQGDGDLAAIGLSEIVHAANRGESFTVIFINNAIYGMTGGQMAPTTLISQPTTTTPQGRSAREGFPLRVCELLATLDAPVYIERVALADNRSIMKARRAVRKAIQVQIENRGFSLVEILSACPTQWGMSPVDSLRWIKEAMIPVFPLAVFRDLTGARDEIKSRFSPAPDSGRPSLEEIPRHLGVTDGIEKTPSPPPIGVSRYQNPRIIISGFGGQGGLFLGELLAECAMRRGYQVSWLPSYGPEMRGGTAHCHVIVSRESIDSPLVDQPTVLLALNEPSLTRFAPKIVPGGLLIYDSSLAAAGPQRTDLEIMAIPAATTADSLGNPKVANMVVLGAYLARTGLLPKELIAETLGKKIADKPMVDLNVRALMAGADFSAGSTKVG
jgi:2-oxoisovalerate ferredoxin oxidoreductase beta subunit